MLNVARYDVFKLNEAMLTGDVGRLARMLDGLKGEGEAAVLVLWALVEEVRTLLRIKRGVAAGKPLATLLRENRVWGPRERLIGPALSRVTESALEKALSLAAQAGSAGEGAFRRHGKAGQRTAAQSVGRHVRTRDDRRAFGQSVAGRGTGARPTSSLKRASA